MSKKKGGPSETAGASETDEAAGSAAPSTEGPAAIVETQVEREVATLPPELRGLVDEAVTQRLGPLVAQVEAASAQVEEFVTSGRVALGQVGDRLHAEIRSEVRKALAEERRGMVVENISMPAAPRVIRVRTRDGRVRHHRARRTFGSTWRELDTHDLTRNELEALTTDPVLEIESD